MTENNGFKLAHRMEHFQTHYFAKIIQKISTLEADGIKVIRLDEGSPDMPPAKFIIDALIKAANKQDAHSYQPHRGNISLRLAWSGMLERLYKIKVDPEKEVLPLLGSKEGIFHFPFVLINPGDIVLIPDPGYITYTRGVLIAEGIPEYFKLSESLNYLPDFSRIPKKILNKVKLMWLNYPNNPTSAMATLDFFEEAVKFAIKHGIIICHDAAYSQITYDGQPAPSIFQVKDSKEVAVEFHTLSKSHNMAGWRVGALIGDSKYIQPFYRLKTNIDSGHFLPILEAATVAMNGNQEWLETRNQIYKQRRDIIIKAINEMGLIAKVPRGSLYIWCSIPKSFNSIDFCTKILEYCHVSITPGIIFGENGEGYVRISITAPTNQIVEAMEKIKGFMSSSLRR